MFFVFVPSCTDGVNRCRRVGTIRPAPKNEVVEHGVKRDLLEFCGNERWGERT